MFILS